MRNGGVAASLMMIVLADIPWADFQNHTHRASVRWIPFVTPPVTALDSSLNVVLFGPLGFFLGAALGEGRRARIRRAFLWAVPLSVMAEYSQVFSHNRVPSTTDVCCNVAGALIGALMAILVLPDKKHDIAKSRPASDGLSNLTHPG